jgi:uncharacterized protein YndB with AHSA1/START domain
MSKEKITISVSIKGTLQDVWNKFNQGEHMIHWNFAADDWYCPKAETDLNAGGKLLVTMAAKDGSFAFVINAIYDKVILNQKVSYTMEDGRTVETTFEQQGEMVHLVETFEAESENSIDLQRTGWQMILDNFKKYCEK